MAGNFSNDLPKEIALVHEWFSSRSFGGAEQVVQAIDQFLTIRDQRPELFALIDGESNRKGSWLFKTRYTLEELSKISGNTLDP